MNNDKRIILAIAVYAAVITMVLHTLSSEGHERFSTTKPTAQYHTAGDPSMPSSPLGILCTEVRCTDEEMVCSQPDVNVANDDGNRTPNLDSYRDEQGALNKDERAS